MFTDWRTDNTNEKIIDQEKLERYEKMLKDLAGGCVYGYILFSYIYNTIKMVSKVFRAIKIVGHKSSVLKMAFGGVSSMQFGDIYG